MYRTHKLNEVNEKMTGKKVILAGWVDTVRDHNNVLFVDLRDRYGKVQCVILKKNDDFEVAKNLNKGIFAGTISSPVLNIPPFSGPSGFPIPRSPTKKPILEFKVAESGSVVLPQSIS